MSPTVALLDHRPGNIRSAHRALESVGAKVEITHDPHTCLNADGLLVPGVGAFAACMRGLRAVHGPRIIGQRLAGERPVLGICVGMQVMFEHGREHDEAAEGCGEWPGSVERLQAKILPHMGWNTVEQPDSPMFAELADDERFYFVHSYGVRNWELDSTDFAAPPKIAWSEHEGDRFVAAVDNGALWATQFHPEKSGTAGSQLLCNWINTL